MKGDQSVSAFCQRTDQKYDLQTYCFIWTQTLNILPYSHETERDTREPESKEIEEFWKVPSKEC